MIVLVEPREGELKLGYDAILRKNKELLGDALSDDLLNGSLRG